MATEHGDHDRLECTTRITRRVRGGGIAALALHRSDGQTRDVEPAELGRSEPRAHTPTLLTRSGTDADRVYIVDGGADDSAQGQTRIAHAQQKAVCVLTVKATLREFDEAVIARVRAELRRLSSDVSLEIIDIEEGGVRLTLSLSPAAARTLLEKRADDRLSEICGFEVSGLVESRAASSGESRAIANTRAGAIQYEDRATLWQDRVAAGERRVVASWGVASTSSALSIATDLKARNRLEGLEQAFVDTRPLMMRLARRMCGNAADAEDLLQDTFLRAVRRGIPPEARNTSAWLTTILHHLFIDRCRRIRRRPNHEPHRVADESFTQLEPDGPEPGWDEISAADIREAVDTIEPVYREVYILHTFEQQSYEQIGRQLGIGRTTVGTRLHRARKKLREVLVARFGLAGDDDR